MDPIEFAATYDLEGDTLSGVVHVFGTRTYREGRWHTFDVGAFDAAIEAGRPLAFYSHDKSKPLARPALAIEDGKLTYSMTLGHQSYADDLRENVRAGLMDKMSFGVFPAKWRDEKGTDGVTRHHTQSDLYDISPVALPAFDGTVAQLHSDQPDSRRKQMAHARWRALQNG